VAGFCEQLCSTKGNFLTEWWPVSQNGPCSLELSTYPKMFAEGCSYPPFPLWIGIAWDGSTRQCHLRHSDIYIQSSCTLLVAGGNMWRAVLVLVVLWRCRFVCQTQVLPSVGRQSQYTAVASVMKDKPFPVYFLLPGLRAGWSGVRVLAKAGNFS
jgi:hypothetical protein